MTNNLRAAAQSLVDAWQIGNGGIGWRVSLLRAALAESVAAPQDATDWEAVSADQAMTIAMLRVDYQQLQALVTSQGIALMEQEEWQKEAARYRFMRVNQSFKFWTEMAKLQPVEWDAYIDAAMGESHDHQTNR